MKKIELITAINSDEYNAGPKAQKDIINILKNRYGEDIIEKTLLFPNEARSKITKRITKNIKKIKEFMKINIDNNIKIIQYPISISVNMMKIINFKKSIIFVHDLMGLRYRNEKLAKEEIKLLEKAKGIIIHNEIMKKYLIEKGISSEKIYVLEVFDYLVNGEKENKKINDFNIIYAGNLKKSKCPFIYQLDERKMKYEINIYGQGIEQYNNRKIKYCGAYPPEELPNKFSGGSTGLIWDGNYDESDEYEGYKQYIKYNNPHKLSCYIAGELPVIVWKKAAIAEIVKKYNIGYLINNLYEINNIDFSTYEAKLENVKELKMKITEGYYTQRVIDEVLRSKENVLK